MIRITSNKGANGTTGAPSESFTSSTVAKRLALHQNAGSNPAASTVPRTGALPAAQQATASPHRGHQVDWLYTFKSLSRRERPGRASKKTGGC